MLFPLPRVQLRSERAGYIYLGQVSRSKASTSLASQLRGNPITLRYHESTTLHTHDHPHLHIRQNGCILRDLRPEGRLTHCTLLRTLPLSMHRESLLRSPMPPTYSRLLRLLPCDSTNILCLAFHWCPFHHVRRHMGHGRRQEVTCVASTTN